MTRAVVVGLVALGVLAACADAPSAPPPVCQRQALPIVDATGRVVAVGSVVWCPPGARDTVDVP